jgi:predicted choloylglycine hydrolase
VRDTVHTSADLRQELNADYRVFELSGDHYAIGYQMGQVTETRPVPSWRDRETELAFARACAQVVELFHPPLLDEFRGYAAARGHKWEEILPQFSHNLPEGTPMGCTTFVRRLPDGHMLVSRNHDFLYTRKERYLRRLSPLRYPATLGAQSGLISSCYDGINSHGLFAALHTVRAQTSESVAPGVPPYLIPRVLLETCRTAQEAVDQIRRIPHLFPFTYLLADPDEMFAVEAHPERVRVRHPRPRQKSTGDYLIVTNYYELPEMRSLHGRRNLTKHAERARWIETRIVHDRVEDVVTGWVWAQGVLRDHSVPVCHHRPNQATLWSLVADLTARRIAYSLGAPCRNEFREYEWPADGT